MEVSPFIGEPLMTSDGEFRLIVIDKEHRLPKIIDLVDAVDHFSIESIATEHKAFALEHHTDWKYPSELHIYDRLDSSNGRVQFRPSDESFTSRMIAVRDRILRYLKTYLRLSGDYDAEIIVAFIISTYFMEMFEYAPRLLIRGATNSGKSTLLRILSELCYRANPSGDTSGATMFRLIDSCNVTSLLDEYQDYGQQAQQGIKKVLKNGTVPGLPVKRAISEANGSYRPRSYDVFGPLAFVNQAGGSNIPEEIINRSMTITMISWGDVTIPMRPDRDELREIRDELYSIKWMWLADPELVGFERIYDEAIAELQNPDGIKTTIGNICYSSRCRDILGTIYTVGKMTDMGDAILSYFNAMQKASKDEERVSKLGFVFAAMMSALESKEDHVLFGNKIVQLLETVTTYDVAKEYEILMQKEGELLPNGVVKTRSVTNILKDMGFTFVRDRNTNHSLFSPVNLDMTFQMNLLKYGSDEQQEKYGRHLTTKHLDKAENVVRSQCQISVLPNNLTRNGE